MSACMHTPVRVHLCVCVRVCFYVSRLKVHATCVHTCGCAGIVSCACVRVCVYEQILCDLWNAIACARILCVLYVYADAYLCVYTSLCTKCASVELACGVVGFDVLPIPFFLLLPANSSCRLSPTLQSFLMKRVPWPG